MQSAGAGVTHHNQAQLSQGAPADGALTQFALRVVSELRRAAQIASGQPDEAILAHLVRHAETGFIDPLTQLYAEMQRKGVTAEQIIDIHFPAAIGRIGADWHEGDLDILQATLQLSRLQTLLRELGRARLSDAAGGADGARVLLVLPHGEQHTLGTMVAANQLRRMGVSVKVSLVPGGREMAQQMQRNRYDGVFVSLSNRSCLAAGGELVETVRRMAGREMPVVVGGGILAELRDAMAPREIAAQLGADLATSDVTRALAACGHSAKTQVAV